MQCQRWFFQVRLLSSKRVSKDTVEFYVLSNHVLIQCIMIMALFWHFIISGFG